MEQHNIKLTTFNCKSVKRSINYVKQLCKFYDIIALQETWLLPNEISYLGNISSDYSFTGTSAVDTSSGMLKGRPYGGVALLWRSNLFQSVSVLQCSNPRVCAVKIVSNDRPFIVVCVYMPTDCTDNLPEFTDCLSAVSAIVDECEVESVYILGDFNAHPAGVILGLVIVGSTDAIFREPGETKGPNSLITGDLLIIVAQVITSCQMVYEEKYVRGLNIPPLQAVGWEGVFGFSVLSALLVVFYWTPAPPHFGHNARGTVEDAVDGLVQIGNNPVLLVAILGTIVSIAFFNFAGISVTKEMSATTRMVLDSVRTLVIWMVSLAVRWQVFHWPHLLGFAVLIYGMAEYNALVPRCRRAPAPAPAPDSAAADDDHEEA
ncbi:uncharacterized protein LOC125240776 isoform X1 [Leguminivora glycinivorella]|uniref:uncharacterized protein LOC125240776 isoform X1 n=1 Tax=Leguminivora glycinivorella TaxID=1035111 RepID=UPI00200F1E09|nr:uncharacterized protein LOC125240776 isoform X1 [Leguminivora glycinivorella]